MVSLAERPRHLRILSWPFHNGHRNVGMGKGASLLATDAQLRAEIQQAGWTVTHEEIDPVAETDPEIARTLELIRRLATRVKQAVAGGAFPLVLAGNCNSALGTTAGLGAGDLGVIWFDAHADFDDPEENESGFFDVMALAMLTGRGWRALRGTIPGHVPVPEHNVILAGVRDLEEYQRRRLASAGLATAPGQIDPDDFDRAIVALNERVSRVYLHVDLDSIDVNETRANGYAAPGGPGLTRVRDCIRTAAERFTVAGAALTAYDPDYDPHGTTLAAARVIARDLAGAIHPQPTPSTG